MTNPITPDEVQVSATKPDEVIESFNELILKYWDGHSARFRQSEVAELIAKKMNVETHVLFDNHYLDVEHIYREAGWKVHYDKPGFNETYHPMFEFSKSDKS